MAKKENGGCCMTARKCRGLLLLVFGVLFFLNTMGYWPAFTFEQYWPLVVIVFGIHETFCRCCECCGVCKR